MDIEECKESYKVLKRNKQVVANINKDFFLKFAETVLSELERLQNNEEILNGELARIGIETLGLEKGSSTDDIIEEIKKKDTEIIESKEVNRQLSLELETSKKETQQVLDDYQDLGKEKYKLECELEKKDKEIRSLKEKIYFKICKNCYQEFEAKRSDAIYCKECSRKVNNANWYSSLTPEQQEEKRRKSKEAMRRLRSKRKEEGEKYEY